MSMGTQGKRAMARLGLGLIFLMPLWACADGGTDTSLGGAGVGLPASGSGGTTPGQAGMGGTTGTAGMGTAGSSPMAGSRAAGTGGMTAGAGSSSAGMGGTRATAGAGGAAGAAGMPAAGDPLIRGPEPTMDTVMKNGPVYVRELYRRLRGWSGVSRRHDLVPDRCRPAVRRCRGLPRLHRVAGADRGLGTVPRLARHRDDHHRHNHAAGQRDQRAPAR